VSLGSARPDYCGRVFWLRVEKNNADLCRGRVRYSRVRSISSALNPVALRGIHYLRCLGWLTDVDCRGSVVPSLESRRELVVGLRAPTQRRSLVVMSTIAEQGTRPNGTY
jgi:hypothetical protein